jgi:hypothetical protein
VARHRVANLAGISGWSSGTAPPPPRERPRVTTPPPLAAAVRHAVLGRIKKGHQPGEIVPLSRVAPELDAPIFIAVDLDLPAIKPSWLPTPIHDIPAPQRRDAPRPEPLRISAVETRPTPPAALPQPPAPVGVAAALPAPVPPHDGTQRRLDAIEAALATLPTHPGPATSTLSSPSALARRVALRRDQNPPNEADVVIVSAARPRQRPAPGEPNPPTPMRSAQTFQTAVAPAAEEAAVSIVKPRRVAVDAIVTRPPAPRAAPRRLDVLRALFRRRSERDPVRPE